MLEKPDIAESTIKTGLQEGYDLQAAQVTFLPLGYDINTAVYRIDTASGKAYFLKLRKGSFDEVTVALPQFLSEQGVSAVIAPLNARTGRQWASLGEYKMILYPFVEGKNGYEVELTAEQWIAFGESLRRIHAVSLPPDLLALLPREDFSPRWREMVKAFQAQAQATVFEDRVASKLASFMKDKRGEIDHLVARAEALSQSLQTRAAEFVLCHSDLHAGNLLIAEDGGFYIVDWDNPCCAPKERDLMFIGSVKAWNTERISGLFFQGYGQAEIDRQALAYYRYERIIEDIAAFCQQLFLTYTGGDDREQAYLYCTGQFDPGHEVEIAKKTDP